MPELTKSTITALRRAAGLLHDLGNESLAAEIDHWVDEQTGRIDDQGDLKLS